jgi:O-succinylbenzoic acid--CoA ligase
MNELSVFAAARAAWSDTALVWPEGRWSWAELARRVTAEILALRRLGLGCPGGPPRVRITAQASPGFVVRFWALAQLGVTSVLLHPRWTTAERTVVAACDPCAWDLDDLPITDRPGRIMSRLDTPRIPPERPLAVVFTSGTAASPKGVILSRAAFVASARASAARLDWHPDDRWLLALPPAHVGGISVLTRCLHARRAVVLGDRLAPDALLAWMAASEVTLASVVPPMLQRLVDAGTPPPKVRAVLVGGGRCPGPLLRRARENGWPVLATYGLSETCSQVATQVPGEIEDIEDASAPPLPGAELRIVDGRVQVSGEMLMSGYYPRGLHREPFTSDGFLDTADFGTLDERGWLRIHGRADGVIVTGGENVVPDEVEEALLRSGAAAEALVFGVEAEPWGEVVAALVVSAGASPAADDVVREALSPIAPFKRPRLLAWVKELPLNASGKADRRHAAQACRHLLRPFAP